VCLGVPRGPQPLHRYNPHFTDGFFIIEPLQRRNKGVTRRYNHDFTITKRILAGIFNATAQSQKNAKD